MAGLICSECDSQERRKRGESNDVLLGEVQAYRGKYVDAARLFKQTGQESHAMNMYR